MLQKQLNYFFVPIDQRQLISSLLETRVAAIDVNTMINEQLHAFELIVFGGPAHLLLKHFCGRTQPIAQTFEPNTIASLSETKLKQQFEVACASSKHPV